MVVELTTFGCQTHNDGGSPCRWGRSGAAGQGLWRALTSSTRWTAPSRSNEKWLRSCTTLLEGWRLTRLMPFDDHLPTEHEILNRRWRPFSGSAVDEDTMFHSLTGR
jgi:hypothetical protein